MTEEFVVAGAEIFPTKFTDHHDPDVTYEVYRVRMVLLDQNTLKTYSVLLGPPQDFESARRLIAAKIQQHPVSCGIRTRLLQSESEIRSFRFRYPERNDLPGTGTVVGHVSMYETRERISGVTQPPQLINAVSIMLENGERHRTIQARLRPPGEATIARDKDLLMELQFKTQSMYVNWPIDSKVKFDPMFGRGCSHFLLAEDLPEENKEVATRESLELLAKNGFQGTVQA